MTGTPPPEKPKNVNSPSDATAVPGVEFREWLSGLLKHYYRKAV